MSTNAEYVYPIIQFDGNKNIFTDWHISCHLR